MTGVSERLDAIEARWGDNPRDDVPYLLGLVRKHQMALESAEALKLDPSTSTTPHCIEEYNAGITNAVSAIRNALEGK